MADNPCTVASCHQATKIAEAAGCMPVGAPEAKWTLILAVVSATARKITQMMADVALMNQESTGSLRSSDVRVALLRWSLLSATSRQVVPGRCALWTITVVEVIWSTLWNIGRHCRRFLLGISDFGISFLGLVS